MGQCDLCHLSLPKNPLSDEERSFCCAGCRAVYQILSAQGALEGARDHPLFHQAARSGVISNPALLEELQESSEISKLHLEIGEMWCPSCADLIQLIVMRLPGLQSVSVDYTTDLALIRYDPRRVGVERILESISRLGYEPHRIEEARGASRWFLVRMVVSFFSLLNLMMFAYPTYAGQWSGLGATYYDQLAYLSFWFALPSALFCAWPIYRRFWSGLRVGMVGMEALVTIGALSSFFLSTYQLFWGSGAVYYDSMAALIFFVLLGKWIERRAKFSVRTSLLQLARALPKRARRRGPDGSYSFVSLKEVVVGETLVAFCGEKIALDGEVVEGEGGCNESLITGEALPVVKRVGSLLVGGSLLSSGWLAYRVSRLPGESTLHRIVEMVQLDLPGKRQPASFVDSIVRWLVPAALLLALALALMGEPLRALSVLLIACPCAIGIAAPLVESLVTHLFSKRGALVRSRAALRLFGREDLYLFDKTGTITRGLFEVQCGLESLSEEQRAQLKGLASQSTHPVSVAIAGAIEGPAARFDRVEERAGLGMVGWIGESSFFLGSSELLGRKILGVGFMREGELLADLQMGDELRPGTAQMVAELDVDAELLSGDSEQVVRRVASEVGLYKWRAGCSPMEKREVVRRYSESGKVVAMVGDGINDGPALSSAHVAISLASASEISIQVADLLLTNGELSDLPMLRELARRGQLIAKQNLCWAFGYNAIGVAMAVVGWLSPLLAALLMVLSSLFVTFNALRLRRIELYLGRS